MKEDFSGMPNVPKYSFEHSSKELSWEDGIEYKFSFPDDKKRPEGEATIIYEKISYLGECPVVYNVFKEAGLKDDDLIVFLNEFYPNGKSHGKDISEFMDKEVGTDVLNFLIEQALKRNVKGVRLMTCDENQKMLDFLDRHGFKPVGDTGSCRRYYKILE